MTPGFPVKYSIPYLIDAVTFTSPLPHIKRNDISLTEPFDCGIWLSINFLIIFTVVMDTNFKCFNWDIMWRLTAILLKQSDIIKSKIRRILLSGWLLAAILLTGFYCGCIYSQMTRHVPVGSISTLGELADAIKSNRINLIAEERDPYYRMIKVFLK